MPAKAVVAISDLHLGCRNLQDAFIEWPEQVERFGRQLADWKSTFAADLTLVLNGDVFDLWALVSDAELGEGPDAAAAIFAGLLVPTADREGLSRLAGGVRTRLGWALTSHPEVGRLLNVLLDAGAHVHVNVGNHDHQLDTELTAAVLKESLKTDGLVDQAERITVDRCYLDRELGFYAEHGDQFGDIDSRSALLPRNEYALREAAGFYVLRYVWNRLQSRPHEWVDFPDWRQIVKYCVGFLFGGDGPVGAFCRYVSDYFRAHQRGDVPLAKHWVFQRLYLKWLDAHGGPESLIGGVAGDLTVEDLQAVAGEVRADQAVPTDLLRETVVAPGAEEARQGAPAPEALRTFGAASSVPPAVSGLPGRVIRLPLPAANDDGYADGLRSRFEGDGSGVRRLDRDSICTVTIGHTHRECQLPLFGEAGPWYLNAGSWTKGHRMLYVWSYGDGASVFSGVRELEREQPRLAARAGGSRAALNGEVGDDHEWR